MTEIEKKILQVILSCERDDENGEAIEIAKLVRELIRKAVNESSETGMDGFLEQWFKDNDS